MKQTKIIITFALAGLILAGCQQKMSDTPGTPPPAKHQHKLLHGGTPVVLGDEEYHLELILSFSEGKLRAFVMDGEFENFVRITATNFEVTARLAGKDETLTFNALANRATGETVGDTSAFEAQADWLKTNTTFDAVLKQLTIRTKVYENVQFNFPKGNDPDDEK